MAGLLDKLITLRSWQISAMGMCACAGLAVLWYVAGYSPLAEARAAHQAMEQDLATKRDDLAHINQLQVAHKKSLERMEAEARGRVSLQPQEKLLDRLSELSRSAAKMGLTLDETKPGAPSPRERFTVVPIHLSGKGAFPGIAAFLHDLRSTCPDTGVVAFNLRGEPEQTDKPAMFVLDLAWYAAKPAAPVKPPAPPEPAAKK